MPPLLSLAARIGPVLLIVKKPIAGDKAIFGEPEIVLGIILGG